jgi:cell division protein FtsI (penicillin-binding protein 3)
MRVSARNMAKEGRYDAFEAPLRPRAPVVEPAPGRTRINKLALLMMAVFAVLGARAVQLSFAGRPESARIAPRAAPAPVVARADLVDRNGVLLATMLPSWILAGEPEKIWDAAQAAKRLATVVPGLDVAATERRLRSKAKFVHLKPGLTTTQRRAVHDLGIAGISFEREQRRVYPNGMLAGHALGGVNRENAGVGGIESALDAEIRRVGGGKLELSLDTRIQYALEAELADAAWGAKAKGGAAVILDGHTGETLAIASWPQVDPNAPGTGAPDARLNRASGAVYEMGSTLKPFTVATAFDAGQLRLDERFDFSAPLEIDGTTIRDPHPFVGPATVREAVVHSSNVAMAEIALRVGAQRQRDYLTKLGLFDRTSIQIGGTPAPLLPRSDTRLTTAVLGYGHGLATSVVSLAGAYTVFTNNGARTTPTLLRRRDGDKARMTPVFTALATQETLQLMRDVVIEGTARRADLRGLDIAGKTGTAEKPGADGKYDPDVLFSSFAAIFPARAPRYVIVLALDEPQRTAENANLATGGAVAAPAVGRVVARITPFLAAQTPAERRSGGDRTP